MNASVINQDVLRRTIANVADVKRIPESNIHIDSTFQELGLDSLDAMNLLFALEEEFHISIPDAEARSIKTVRDACEGVTKLVDAKQQATGNASGQ